MGILRFCNKIFHNVLQRRALQAHFLCFQWSRNQQIFCFSESCTCSLFLPLCTLCILHSGNLYQYWFIYSYKPRYLSPIYRNRKKKRKQMMQPMTARAILPQVQGRWTVSSWFPHFEHLWFFDKALAIYLSYIFSEYLWWNFLKVFIQNGRNAHGRRQQIHVRNLQISIANIKVNMKTNTMQMQICKYKY